MKHPILKVNREPIRFYEEFMKNQLKLMILKKDADQSHENENLKKNQIFTPQNFSFGIWSLNKSQITILIKSQWFKYWIGDFLPNWIFFPVSPPMKVYFTENQ